MIPQTRRAFLRKLGFLSVATVPLSGAAAYGYGSTLERHRIVVEQHTVPLLLGQRGPQKLRLVSLTDLHFDPLYEEDYIQSVVTRVNALQPDIVALTGDYVTHTNKRIQDLAKILSGMTPRHGIYACLGNHDYWHAPTRTVKAMRQQGIGVLLNQHTRIAMGTEEVVIAGLESVWGGQPAWATAAHGLRPDDAVITLMHEPDYADTLRQEPRIALQCSGHTHGGQVRVPFYGALLLPSYGKHYQAGFYKVGQMQLYVGRGIGTVDQHVRFLCPPEITCFDILNRSLI